MRLNERTVMFTLTERGKSSFWVREDSGGTTSQRATLLSRWHPGRPVPESGLSLRPESGVHGEG